MIDGMVVYAVFWLVVGLPAYATGWLILRILRQNVESIPAWWSRTVNAALGKAKKSAFLKYEFDGHVVMTAEYAFQVGCLFWISLLVLAPVGAWFLFSAFA